MSMRADESYGQRGLTMADRLGVWLSQRAIRRYLPRRDDLEVLELGCGYHAAWLIALNRTLKRGIGVDFHIAPELQALERFTFREGTIEDKSEIAHTRGSLLARHHFALHKIDSSKDIL